MVARRPAGVKEPAFAIITPERAFVFVVATAQERQHWLKAVSDGILSNIHSKVTHHPILRETRTRCVCATLMA
jgi:hypothetical protein